MPGTTTHYAIPYPEEKDEANQGATKITEALKALDTLLFEGKAGVGAWTALALNGKAKELSAGNVRARLEQGGAVVRLRGVLEQSTEITSAEAIATLPVGMRPTQEVILYSVQRDSGSFVSAFLTIQTTGTITSSNGFPAGGRVTLDGITFPAS